MKATGTFMKGGHVIARSIKVGDRIVLSNEGPSLVYLTSDTVGKDIPIPAKAFLSWGVAKNNEQVSIIIQDSQSTVSLEWIDVGQTGGER